MTENKKVCSYEELLSIIEASISKNGVFPLVVTGTSMTPTLYSNRDVVHLVSPTYKTPKKYDIVLFKRPDGAVILHRIIKKLPNNRYLINGDSQTWTEEINSSQIVAITKSYIKNNKKTSCNTTGYKIKSAIWCTTRRFRPFLFKFSSLLKGRKYS
ncbi:MAG: S24/S26 family peptidase [Acutalibacteraceae bacterium]|nr:S24/S26 family peptidase [Acutalibacteraceae bacterium]